MNDNQPAEAMPHYPERLIPIVAFADERFSAFPDVPTHVELGIGTDGDGRYADLFEKVWETPEWQEFIANNAMTPIFMGPDAYKEWLVTFEDNHASLMTEVFGWELRPDLRLR